MGLPTGRGVCFSLSLCPFPPPTALVLSALSLVLSLAQMNKCIILKKFKKRTLWILENASMGQSSTKSEKHQSASNTCVLTEEYAFEIEQGSAQEAGSEQRGVSSYDRHQDPQSLV